MTERLNNDQISKRIIDTNSDLKRYLSLAPSIKINPPSNHNTTGSKAFMTPLLSSRPPVRP